MLVFRFRTEFAGTEKVNRPRLKVCINTQKDTVIAFALLDSGADRTIIPESLARVLSLRKGPPARTAGIGGSSEGYESIIDNIIFVDETGKMEKITEIPVYVLADFEDIVIGRNKIFDVFRIVFEQFNDKIILERK